LLSFGGRAPPGPAGGAHSAPLDSQLDLGEGKGKRKGREKGKERKGRGGGKEGRKPRRKREGRLHTKWGIDAPGTKANIVGLT